MVRTAQCLSVNFFMKPLRHCWYPSKSDWAMKWSPQMTDVSLPRFQSFRVDDTNLSHFLLTAWLDGIFFKPTKHCKYLVFICYILIELAIKYISLTCREKTLI